MLAEVDVKTINEDFTGTCLYVGGRARSGQVLVVKYLRHAVVGKYAKVKRASHRQADRYCRRAELIGLPLMVSSLILPRWLDGAVASRHSRARVQR